MLIDQKLSKFSAQRGVLRNGLNTTPALGIELEYERTRRMPRINPSPWRIEGDGSLRTGGVEFISNPLWYGEIENALSVAEATVDYMAAVATHRCGLHVHINMRPFSVGQIWSVAALYILVEPTIYATYAVNREENTFAVPLWLNRPIIQALGRDMTRIRSYEPGGADQKVKVRPSLSIIQTDKYSALNFQSLVRFGTIEMRQPYCTNDFDAIRSWCDFVIRLQQQGCNYRDPIGVLDHYSNVGLAKVQEDLFGGAYEIHPDIQEQAEDAAALMVGRMIPHWETLNWNVLGEQ